MKSKIIVCQDCEIDFVVDENDRDEDTGITSSPFMVCEWCEKTICDECSKHHKCLIES